MPNNCCIQQQQARARHIAVACAAIGAAAKEWRKYKTEVVAAVRILSAVEH